MKELKSRLLSLRIPAERILTDEPMSRHTSFRVGGPADLFVTVESEAELAAALQLLTAESVPHLLVGNGSNLLVADAGYRGVVLRLGGEFCTLTIGEDGVIRAGSAMLLSRVSAAVAEQGLAGMEFASGIPGSIGGAVFMNAGAYGGEMKDILLRARLLSPDGAKAEVCEAPDLALSYRYSRLQEDGRIVLQAELQLTPGDPEEIQARIRELTEKRNAKQPVNFPSAGSTFKRPEVGYAAAMIEQAGLKGVSVGGAEVSEKHSGFIINRGGATADDVLALMRIVRARVYEQFGTMLEPEVRIIGTEL